MYLKSLSSLRAQFSAGNPYAGHIPWYVATWPAARSPAVSAYLWAIAGDAAELEQAKQFQIPYHGEAGMYRQDGLDALLIYHLLKDHVEEEIRGQWEAGIKRMCTSALRHNRRGDADERRCHLMIWAICDRWFGTSYLTANERVDTASPYYVEWDSPADLMASHVWEMENDAIDGATSESTGYMINSQNKWLIGVAITDKDILPGIRAWLPKFREFLLWGVSYDCKHSHVFGDAQESLDSWYQWNLWYRLPLYWMMVGIDEDPDGQLAALAKRLAEWRAGGPITTPSQLHPTLYWPWALLADLDKVANPPPLQLETGFKFFRPGFAIYRSEDTYFYFTGTRPMNDDHDAVAQGGSDYRVYHKGKLRIDRPGAYAGPWQSYNGAALKGHSWLWDRGTDLAELLPDGRVHIKYHQRGPMQSMMWMGPDDYVDSGWMMELFFNPVQANPTLDVAYTWKHTGIFPDPSQSQYYPQLQSYLPCENGFFTAPEVQRTGNKFTWDTASVVVGGSQEITVEQFENRGQHVFDWVRMKSAGLEATHTLAFVVNSADVPSVPPTPPVTPPVVVELPPAQDLQVVNQGDAGYSISGGWVTYPGQGIGGQVDYIQGGDGSFVASWQANASAGRQRVSTTWEANSNRATDSPFVVKVNGQVAAERKVNQELVPASFQDEAGVWWHELVILELAQDSLVEVQLNNKANDHVIADAVRIERVVAQPPEEIELKVCYRPGTKEIVIKLA
jgi:hypothetical protein